VDLDWTTARYLVAHQLNDYRRQQFTDESKGAGQVMLP